jgi:hypothetical protein
MNSRCSSRRSKPHRSSEAKRLYRSVHSGTLFCGSGRARKRSWRSGQVSLGTATKWLSLMSRKSPSARTRASRSHGDRMDERPLTIDVDCYAGHRSEQTPRTLILDGRRIGVAEVVDAWLAPLDAPTSSNFPGSFVKVSFDNSSQLSALSFQLPPSSFQPSAFSVQPSAFQEFCGSVGSLTRSQH